MKIVFLCNEYPPYSGVGGIGVFTHTLVHGLVEAGYEVTVLGLGKDYEERYDCGARVVILPESTIRGIAWLINRRRLYSWLKREVRKGQIDLIETPEYQGLLPFRFPWCPVVVRLHLNSVTVERIMGRKARWNIERLERRTISLHRSWIPVSKYILEVTQNEFQCRPVQHKIIYNPYRVIKSTVPSLPIGIPPRYVLFAGTVSNRKGAFVLAEAACSFLSAHPEIYLVYVGELTVENGKRADHKIREILGAKLAARVHFTGRVEHDIAIACMERAEVFAFPSKLESFGLAPVEAMSCGVPVVYSKMHAGPEVVDDGVTGCLVDPYSPDDVAEKVLRLLNDKKFAAQLAENARQTIEVRFSLQRCIDETIAFYKFLLKKAANERRKIV